MNPHLRNRRYAPAAPFPYIGHLSHDLLAEIPGQQQQIVRLRFGDPVGMVYYDVGARQEAALLVGAAIDDIVDEVRPDAAIVQQRVALGWRPIADDGLAPLLVIDEEAQQPALAS